MPFKIVDNVPMLIGSCCLDWSPELSPADQRIGAVLEEDCHSSELATLRRALERCSIFAALGVDIRTALYQQPDAGQIIDRSPRVAGGLKHMAILARDEIDVDPFVQQALHQLRLTIPSRGMERTAERTASQMRIRSEIQQSARPSYVRKSCC